MHTGSRFFVPIDFKMRFPALDGIRALAIMLVFADHYGGGSHGGGILRVVNIVRQRGWIGVDLFFVLSGFLITGILYDTRNDSRYFERFFARRSLRIFPVFYLVVLVLLLLTPVLHYQLHWLQMTFLIYLGNFFGNTSFGLYTVISAAHPSATVTLGHFWSLCVEEQFYLLWPIAVFVIRNRISLIRTATGISLLALLLRLIMLARCSPEVSETWIVRTLPFRMDTLLIGAILALVLRGPAAEKWQRAGKSVFLTATAGILAVFAFSPAYDSPWLLSVGLTSIACASAGLIAMTLHPASSSFQLFSFKPLRILGKYSYGFYIYHLLFRVAWIHLLTVAGAQLHSIALAGIIELTLAFATTFLVSKLSYDLFEVRFLRLKSRFEYDSELITHRHAFTVK